MHIIYLSDISVHQMFLVKLKVLESTIKGTNHDSIFQISLFFTLADIFAV